MVRCRAKCQVECRAARSFLKNPTPENQIKSSGFGLSVGFVGFLEHKTPGVYETADNTGSPNVSGFQEIP